MRCASWWAMPIREASVLSWNEKTKSVTVGKHNVEKAATVKSQLDCLTTTTGASTLGSPSTRGNRSPCIAELVWPGLNAYFWYSMARKHH